MISEDRERLKKELLLHLKKVLDPEHKSNWFDYKMEGIDPKSIEIFWMIGPKADRVANFCKYLQTGVFYNPSKHALGALKWENDGIIYIQLIKQDKNDGTLNRGGTFWIEDISIWGGMKIKHFEKILGPIEEYGTSLDDADPELIAVKLFPQENQLFLD